MLSSASIALNTAYAAQNGKTNKTYETIAAVRGAYSFGTYPSIQPWAVRCSVLWCSCIRGRTCEDDLVDAAFHVFTGNPHEFTANAAMASSSLWRRARVAPRGRAASTGAAGARSAHAISATHARRARVRGNLIVGAQLDERCGAPRENSARCVRVVTRKLVTRSQLCRPAGAGSWGRGEPVADRASPCSRWRRGTRRSRSTRSGSSAST